jgi:hypothetical protein
MGEEILARERLRRDSGFWWVTCLGRWILQRRGPDPRDSAGKYGLSCANAGGQGRDRTGDLPLFRRTLIPTELPGPTAPLCLAAVATLTGLEPATSAVTGRRANQLRHRALLVLRTSCDACTPYGIRTRATALKGRRPRPLDEGGQPNLSGVLAAS